MIVRLIQARAVRLTAWTPYLQILAVYAQSRVRHFDRWFLNKRISVHRLYGPLIQPALAQWEQNVLYLVLVTSTLRDMYWRLMCGDCGG
jgi:hypothetical protein